MRSNITHLTLLDVTPTIALPITHSPITPQHAAAMPQANYGTSGAGPSSYDAEHADEYVSMDQYRNSMKLVRLQMSIPLSILIALGTLMICGLIINPGIGEIEKTHPTLLSPNHTMVAGFAVVLFILQIGFCLLLACASSDWTKDTMIKGVGLRMALVNWLTAAWAVCWALSLFRTAEIILIVETIIILSIHFTLQSYPSTFAHPLNAIFVHTTVIMLLAITLGLGWMTCGFVAQDWVIEKRKEANSWRWEAVGVVLGTHVVSALWELFTRQYVLAICMEYMVLTLLLSTPHVYPSLPDNPIIKPAAYKITLIALLAVHPLACVAGWALRRYIEAQRRVALEEEVEDADARARQARARLAEERGEPPAAGAAAAAAEETVPPAKKKKGKVNPEEEPLLAT